MSVPQTETDAVSRSRHAALAIAQAALAAVHGRAVVGKALRDRAVTAPVHLIAIGKAAAAMSQGALDAWGDAIVRGLVITKTGYGDHRLDPRITCREAAHPLPDASSMAAGTALLDFLNATPAHVQLLFLISGGASSLVEVLAPGVSLEDLQRANTWLLGSGLPIAAINGVRKMLSAIKGGKLLQYVGGRKTLALLISDVQYDDPVVIGSGLLSAGGAAPSVDRLALPLWLTALCRRAPDADAPANTNANVETHIVASLADAQRAAAQHAQTLGYPCRLHTEFLAGDAAHSGEVLAHQLRSAPAGVHIWGGETTVMLPACPGRGGRNQTLALAAALALQGRDDCILLALATDGSDGPGGDAGALIDGGSVARGELAGCDARHSLHNADAGTFLEASGDLVHTGPTGTNVMDIFIGIKTA